MNLIKNVLIDLNNVGENYSAFQQLLPVILPDVISKVVSVLGVKANADEIQSVSDRYLRVSGTNPLQHYPSFWQHTFETLLKKNFTYEEVERIYQLYLDEYERNVDIYPDFLSLNDACKQRLLKTGIIANGNAQRIYRFIRKFKLTNRFDTIVSSGMNPFSKPAPEIFRLALLNLGTTPIETVFIGDRLDTDILGANSSGIWSIRLLRGIASDISPSNAYELPDFTVNGLDDVLSLPLFNYQSRIASVIIPCGGKGSRMNELASQRQKCMVEIKDEPILSRLVVYLRDAGFRDFHFIVGHRSEDVIQYFGDGARLGIEAHYHKPGMESTGRQLFTIADQLPDTFLYVHGNILFNSGLLYSLLKQFYKLGCITTFALTKKPIAPTHPVFMKRDGVVNQILRHPDSAVSDFYYSIGLGCIQKNQIPTDLSSFKEEDLTTEQLFANSANQIQTLDYTGDWFHLEQQSDIANYQQHERRKHLYA